MCVYVCVCVCVLGGVHDYFCMMFWGSDGTWCDRALQRCIVDTIIGNKSTASITRCPRPLPPPSLSLAHSPTSSRDRSHLKYLVSLSWTEVNGVSTLITCSHDQTVGVHQVAVTGGPSPSATITTVRKVRSRPRSTTAVHHHFMQFNGSLCSTAHDCCMRVHATQYMTCHLSGVPHDQAGGVHQVSVTEGRTLGEWMVQSCPVCTVHISA